MPEPYKDVSIGAVNADSTKTVTTHHILCLLSASLRRLAARLLAAVIACVRLRTAPDTSGDGNSPQSSRSHKARLAIRRVSCPLNRVDAHNLLLVQ